VIKVYVFRDGRNATVHFEETLTDNDKVRSGKCKSLLYKGVGFEAYGNEKELLYQTTLERDAMRHSVMLVAAECHIPLSSVYDCRKRIAMRKVKVSPEQRSFFDRDFDTGDNNGD